MSTSYDLPAPLAPSEELANRLTHGVGLLLAVVGTAVLLARAIRFGDAWQVGGVIVYGATLMALYAASTLSHSFARPRVRHFFRTVDQVCIFLLIAGTFTPISLTYLREGWWSALLISMWTLALVGIICKLFFTRLHNVNVLFYILMGWMPVIAIKPIMAVMPVAAMWWMVAGGVLYTAGTLFLMRDERVPYFHALWHVFVIAASACHYVAMLHFIG